MFLGAALVGCLFAAPAALRTFLLIFFSGFFVTVLAGIGLIKGWQSAFRFNARLRLALLGAIFAILFSLLWFLQSCP